MGTNPAIRLSAEQRQRKREITAGARRNFISEVMGHDKEKQKALNTWGARLSRMVSGLELVKAEQRDA